MANGTEGAAARSSEPAPPVRKLAETFSALAQSLEDEGDLQSTLDAIARAAVSTVPGCDDASIAQVHGRRHMTTLAASGPMAVENDEAQNATGQGPCLDTLYEKRTAHVPDTAEDPRWPRFAARVHDVGIGSLLSVQLYVKGEDLGALNLSSRSAHAFDEASEDVALLFASHASVAMIGAQKEEQLRDALSTHDVIGQAMGIVMARYEITAERAFSVLVRHSQHSNRRLLDLAEEIVNDRDLPRPRRAASQ
jgi:GAF domain-containing protein